MEFKGNSYAIQKHYIRKEREYNRKHCQEQKEERRESNTNVTVNININFPNILGSVVNYLFENKPDTIQGIIFE